MGDRCYFSIRFAARDKKKFVEIDHYLEESDIVDDHTLGMDFDEMNYGGDGYVQELASAGLTFLGWHGAGYSYMPGVFACYKGDLAQCRSDDESNVVISFDENMNPNQFEMGEARHYYQIIKKVDRYIYRQPFDEITTA